MVFASEWLELDSPVEGIRFDSELVSSCFQRLASRRALRANPPLAQALRQEIAYASYLSLTTIILPPPRLENREYLADYARAVNAALASSWHIHVTPNLFLLALSSLLTARTTTDLYSYPCS